ncbi:MAG: helix-turn-helix transcriptional regulator, partial [Bacillota bacterium]
MIVLLGKTLKELRAQKSITQEELAKVIGVTTSMVGMYETDARNPSFEVLKKISEYFKVSADYLLGYSNHKRHVVDSEAYADGYDEEPTVYEEMENDLRSALYELLGSFNIHEG